MTFLVLCLVSTLHARKILGKFVNRESLTFQINWILVQRGKLNLRHMPKQQVVGTRNMIERLHDVDGFIRGTTHGVLSVVIRFSTSCDCKLMVDDPCHHKTSTCLGSAPCPRNLNPNT